MPKKFFALTIAVVLLFAVFGTVNAVPWGQPDNGAHPQVVTLLFQRPDGYYICSGTLLSPYVVLTAGHCTEANGQTNIATWVRNDDNMDAAYASERPNYPSLAAWLRATWISAQVVPHPQFADFAGFPNTHDLGLALLSRALVVPQYGQLPTAHQFDFLDTQKGSTTDRQVTVVGYGIQQQVPIVDQIANSDWVRYVGHMTVTNSRNQYTDGYNFQYTSSPGVGTGTGGTCHGDSGGPEFWQDTLTIVTVTSYGITTYCTGVDFNYRVDLPESLDFITPYLSWHPRGH
jgi:secreted trypsin-like serine protease